MTIPPLRPTFAGLIVAAVLLLGAPAFAQGTQTTSMHGTPIASGGKVAAHSRAHKSKVAVKNPAQPVPPPERLTDAPNQIKEQVAPTPDAPVKPGSNIMPGQDTAKPQSR